MPWAGFRWFGADSTRPSASTGPIIAAIPDGRPHTDAIRVVPERRAAVRAVRARARADCAGGAVAGKARNARDAWRRRGGSARPLDVRASGCRDPFVDRLAARARSRPCGRRFRRDPDHRALRVPDAARTAEDPAD